MRHRGFRAVSASLLAAIFFAAQAFACCHANREIGRAVTSLFAHPAPAAHACCAKAASAPVPEKPGCEKECCIQDAGRNAPQLASEAVPAPAFPLAVAFLTLPRAPAPVPARCDAPIKDTGPPVYLRTLRLLV